MRLAQRYRIDRSVRESRMDTSANRSRRASSILAALAVLAAVGMEPAHAQQEGILTVARVNRITPACRDHPGAPWIGRVAGNIEGLVDGYIPVSWVGCFPTRESCEAWRTHVSGILTERITQNSCRPRG